MKLFCAKESCLNMPMYVFPNARNVWYCVEHVEPGMVHVGRKVCSVKDCGKFGEMCKKDNVPTITYCKEHADGDMVDVDMYVCGSPQCYKMSTFGFEGDVFPTRCQEHPMQHMIRMQKHMTCYVSECSFTPRFGYSGPRRKISCSHHKDPYMINLSSYGCKFPECDNARVYAEIGSKKEYCIIHKEEYMVENPYTRCIYPRCNNAAVYALHGLRTHCRLHVADRDVGIERKCVMCWILCVPFPDLRCQWCTVYSTS